MTNKTSISLNLIVCATIGNGIGKSGKLPWKLKKDMKYFKFITSFIPTTTSINENEKEAEKEKEKEKENQKLKNVVIMGRKTWESIPLRFKPLENRINIIVSRNQTYESLGISKGSHEVFLSNSLTNACEIIRKLAVYKTYLIGGSELYNQIIHTPILENIYELKSILMTRVLGDEKRFECDRFLNEFRNDGNGWKMCEKDRFLEWIGASEQDLEKELGFHITQQDGIQDEDGCQIEFQLWEREPM